MAVLAAAAWLLLPLAVGCGDDGGTGDSAGDAPGDEGTGDEGTGDTVTVLTVSEAGAEADGTAVTVRGLLIEDSGVLLLAEALAESYPPQPGGATLEVDGLDIGTFDDVVEAGPVRWLDRPIVISGTIDGGRLTGATAVEEDPDGG